MTVIINGTTGITSVNGTAAAPSVTGTDTDTGIVYGTNALSLATGGTTALTANSSQGIQVLNTIGVGNTTPSTSGAGISFPATQSASTDANTLDDYEEGTWTPALKFGGGSTGLTYNSRYGFYTKVGNLVSVTCYYSVANKGSSTGVAKVDGLPFTVKSASGMYSRAPLYYNSLASSVTTEVSYADGNTTYVNLMKTGGTLVTEWTEANFQAGSDMMVTFSYFTA